MEKVSERRIKKQLTKHSARTVFHWAEALQRASDFKTQICLFKTVINGVVACRPPIAITLEIRSHQPPFLKHRL